jgi:hypothetical protein
MDWNQIYLDTFIPELPKYWNGNFASFKRYLDVFYDEKRTILIKPLETTGKVKGARGEFVTAVVDNLIVKNQFTNLYDNTTTIDSDFVNSYIGNDDPTRVATSEASTNYIWPYEPSAYSWIDVNHSYFKIGNDASYGFQNDNLGQEFRVIFNTDVSTTAPYTILLESSIGGAINLTVDYSVADLTWVKLITTSYDASYGPTWTVKEYGGIITIS